MRERRRREAIGLGMSPAPFILALWARAHMIFWASLYQCSGLGLILFSGLLLARLYCIQLNSGTPTGIGDGELQNVTVPTSPDGDQILAVKLPAGIKIAPFRSPNG